MGNLTSQEIVAALERLGEFAQAGNENVEVLLVGGAVMVLAYDEREATRDVDAIILAPRDTLKVREWAKRVSEELDLPEDWLNDAAKGYLVGLSIGDVIFSAPGIRVRRPSVEQLLAMKLSAWRDDVDISDARRLLREMPGEIEREQVWDAVEPYIVPGHELKAHYALQDLWEELHGSD